MTDNDGQVFSLRQVATFGDVAAEEDSVLDYFLTTDAVQRIEDNEAFLVLGRKGSGKTALVRYFTEGRPTVLSKALNLKNYPWNIHGKRIDNGASEIEAYVSSWRYLIAVELAALVLSETDRPQFTEVIQLKQFMTDNYGGVDPNLADVLRPKRLKLSKLSFMPRIFGNTLGGIDLDRAANDGELGLELNALSDALLKSIQAIASNEELGPLVLHFDELDQGLSRLDETRSRMLIGLILAARGIRTEMKKGPVEVNPVVYLRTDIWNELQFSDKNKIDQGQSIKIEWSPDNLLELVNLRISAKLGEGASWDKVSTDNLMRGSQSKWKHILSKGFLRPRDTIRFLNAALVHCKKRDDEPCIFDNQDILDAREEYSNYLKNELDDEILPHWQYWEEALQACSRINTISFDRSQFVTLYNEIKSEENTVNDADALKLLYRFSVIGCERRYGSGGRSWAFQYKDQEAGYDSGVSKLKVHLGLKEFAKLVEERNAPNRS